MISPKLLKTNALVFSNIFYSSFFVGKYTPMLEIAFALPLLMQLPSVYTGIESDMKISFLTPIKYPQEFEMLLDAFANGLYLILFMSTKGVP